MGTKLRGRLVNFNRVLIFALTLAGLLMDGYQNSDMPFTLALLVWLWLAVFTQMEAKILRLTGYLSTGTRIHKRTQRLTNNGNDTSTLRLRRKPARVLWAIDCHRNEPHSNG